MASEIPNNSNMIDLAKPARWRHVLVMFISAPFVALFTWGGILVAKDADLSMWCTLLFMASWVVFPFTRSFHALFAKPHFRANDTTIDLRHWGGGWSWFLPFHLIHHDRLLWSEILRVNQKRTSYNFITIESYAIIERLDHKPIHVHRGVFDLSVDGILNLIQNRFVIDKARDSLPSNHAKPYIKRLERYFETTWALRYNPAYSRLVGLIVGLPAAVVGCQWLVFHGGDNTKLDIPIAIGSCMATGWLILAIDEAVRCFRFHAKKFWFRVDGFAVGANEFTAKVYGWPEIVGATWHYKQEYDLWGKPLNPKLDGIDILLRDGGTVWIPEKYSSQLDELREILSPNESEAIVLADEVLDDD